MTKAFGGHGEYKAINEKKRAFAHVPEGLDFETAAALTEGSHYAFREYSGSKSRFQPPCSCYWWNGSDRPLQLYN